MTFKVGDRVMYIAKCKKFDQSNGRIHYGDSGTIVDICRNSIGIKFDRKNTGWSNSTYKCESNGWNFFDKTLPGFRKV